MFFPGIPFDPPRAGISARTLQRMENDPNFNTTRGTAYKVAYEITFNPALANPEVIKLMDKWNMENEKKTSKTFSYYQQARIR